MRTIMNICAAAVLCLLFSAAAMSQCQGMRVGKNAVCGTGCFMRTPDQCSAGLQCFYVAPPPKNLMMGRRCVGKGTVGDFCAISTANDKRGTCEEKLVCEVNGNQEYRCAKPTHNQNEFCGKSAPEAEREFGCAAGLNCNAVDKGSTVYRCLGRGRLSDFCSATFDAKTGGKNCSANLACRETGNNEWNCVVPADGGDGALCAVSDAGRTGSCAGKLKCRKEKDGKHRCRN